MAVARALVPPETQVVQFSFSTERAIVRALHQNGITEPHFSLSPMKIKALSFYFLRDMYRIEEEQSRKISSTKFAGYWAFWIRKIKPIGNAFNPNHDDFNGDKHEMSEVTTINELIAIDVATNFLAHEGKGAEDGHMHDFIRHDCAEECNGATCLLSYAQRFFEFRGNINQGYLLSSLMHRTFGPHHMTMILEHMVFAGCRKS
jgi:hypothetical protein